MDPTISRSRSNKAPSSGKAGDLAELALWMAATLAGMVTAILIARRPFFERLVRKVGRGRRSRAVPSRQQSLPMLAHAIVGSSKTRIQSVFGPPRSAMLRDIGIVVHPQKAFWYSDMWYYPLPRNGRMAMAISFDDNMATQVEFFTAAGIG